MRFLAITQYMGGFYMADFKEMKGSLSIDSENIFPIIKKWLYQDHDIFYRELISNGCDAVTKLKKLSLIGEYEAPADEKYRIDVTVDPDKKTITVSDNGLGMTEEEVQDYINQGVPLSDLIQEASMELMLLADEGFEGSFETLLESRIRVRLEEVVKEQKSEADIEEEMLARVNVLQEVSKTMAEQLGREATLAELAERMKMTEDEVREIMKVTMDALSMSEINRSLQS